MSIDKTRRKIFNTIPRLLVALTLFKTWILEETLNEIEREGILRKLTNLEDGGDRNERT